jgi:hypothetical protein
MIKSSSTLVRILKTTTQHYIPSHKPTVPIIVILKTDLVARSQKSTQHITASVLNKQT